MRLRVRPTPATALPDDMPRVVDFDASHHQVASRALVGDERRSGDVVVLEVVVDGWRLELEIESADRAELRERATRGRSRTEGAGPLEIRAIIPGRVVSLAVVTGDTVVTGQPLLVLEAMKMQNELRAPRDGTVARIAALPGGTVELGDILLVLR